MMPTSWPPRNGPPITFAQSECRWKLFPPLSTHAYWPLLLTGWRPRVARTSDTALFAGGVPSITHGLRGLVGIEFALHGAKTELRSGMYGGTVANPAHALCEVIAKLHDADGRVTVPGFYDRVLPLADAE